MVNVRHKIRFVRKAKMITASVAALYMIFGFPVISNDVSSGNPVNVDAAMKIDTVAELPVLEEDEASEDDELIWQDELEMRECYLLAKLAMAEAEGEDIEGKAYVIMVVLNRVQNPNFPNCIEDVIFQYNEEKNVYQFATVRPDGRWWKTDPDEQCWEAVAMVRSEGLEKSRGATYFESYSESQWHQNNLEFLFQHGNHYFYTDKEK